MAVLAVALCVSCKTTQPSGADPVRKTAVEKLGENIESFPSASGQFVLFVQKQTDSPAALKFIVIHAPTNEVIEAQTFMPGHVKWVTEDSLEVLSVPGMVKSSEDLSRYIKVVHIRTPN